MANVTARNASEVKARIIYRQGAGEVHLDWPLDRLREAVSDDRGLVWLDLESPGRDGDQPRPGKNGIAALLGETFGFHPLAIEDALQEVHLPKLDDWGQYLYLVCHSIEYVPASRTLKLHELDVFLGPTYLVTYHNGPIPTLEQIYEGLGRSEGDRLKEGPPRLLYQVLDGLATEYMTLIEHLDEAIDEAQDEVLDAPTPGTLQQILQIKRAALRMHRILAPLREVLNRMARDAYSQIGESERVYFRDVYDHLVRLHDIAETLRDLIASALDTYLSAMSNRTNDVMKVLTLVTVMFLPMSVVVGFFGMNFFANNLALTDRLPTSAMFWFSLVFMVLTPWVMAFWARRKGWF